MPLLAVGGAITFIILVVTAVIGKMVLKGKAKLKLHIVLAGLTIIFAFLHGLLGLSIFFRF